MYTLFAHGGDLTAGRRTAAYVYGDWSVSLPDGVDSELEDKYLGQGYIARVNDKPRGRFDHTFIKEGASIDMQSRTTDLELVLDDAFSRTDGDVFFQHDIEGVGLNGTLPERDYTVGDLVRVMRWNRAMVLPVTGTSLKSDDDGRVVGSTHVGGELISSKRTTQKLSDELRRSIARETTEIVRTETKPLRGDVSTIRSSVTSLGTDLVHVRGVAETTQATVSTVVSRVDTVATTMGTVSEWAEEAKRMADSALKTVDLATGDMGQYLDQVQDMVKQAGDEASKAASERRGAESTYESMKTLVTQATDLNAQVGQKVNDAQGLVKQIKQVSSDLDPKVKAATDLLAKATEANTTAIKLNNDADALRDRAIVDLSEAGKKLTQSQAALQSATELNTASIENLSKSQREHAAATKELGTAQQALAKSVENNSKVINAVNTSQTALKTAQEADRKATAEALSSQKEMVNYSNKTSKYLEDMVEFVAAVTPSTHVIYATSSGYDATFRNLVDKYPVSLRVYTAYGAGNRLGRFVIYNMSDYHVSIEFSGESRFSNGGNIASTYFSVANLAPGEQFGANSTPSGVLNIKDGDYAVIKFAFSLYRGLNFPPRLKDYK